MSGVSFWEFLFICMIGLVVLGPERLPRLARQIGSWIGQARRMTRTMRRQLEEEIDLEIDIEKELGIESIEHSPPRDDDTYSPLHAQQSQASAAGSLATDSSTTRQQSGQTDEPERHQDDPKDRDDVIDPDRIHGDEQTRRA